MKHILIIRYPDGTYCLTCHDSIIHAELWAEQVAPIGSEWVIWHRRSNHNPFKRIRMLKEILKEKMEGVK